MSIPLPESNARRVKTAIDGSYQSALYKMSQYAVTGLWSNKLPYAESSHEWAWMPDFSVDVIETGSLNKVLVSSKVKKSRLLSGEIVPESENLSRILSNSRKAWWKARANGQGQDSGPWAPHIFSYFDDFDILGWGACCIEVADSREYILERKSWRNNGKSVCIRNIPASDVVYDPTVRDPRNSRWVAYRTFVPLYEAEKQFGKISEEGVHHVRRSSYSDSYAVVQVIDYFDVGLASSEPSWTRWIGRIDNAPYKHQRNPFGALLPVSFMVGSLPPKCAYPIGSVLTLMRTQELLNIIQRKVLSVSKKGPVDIWNERVANSQDISNYVNGINNGSIRVDHGVDTSEITNALVRHPGAQLSNADMVAWEHAQRHFDESSGASQIDQGNTLDSQRTLGEIQQIQASSSSNRAFDDQCVKNGMIDLCEKVFRVAHLFDTAPVEVEIELPDQSKRSVTINDGPLKASELFEKAVPVVLDSGALTAQDSRIKRLERLQDIEKNILPLLATGVIDPTNVAKHVLTALGEESLEEWLVKPQMPLA